MSPVAAAKPMRYDPAGWSIELADGTCFQVWAPLAAGSDAASLRLREDGRDHWQVAWTDGPSEGEFGDCRQGATFEVAAQALDSYPDPSVRAVTRRALEHASRSTS